MLLVTKTRIPLLESKGFVWIRELGYRQTETETTHQNKETRLERVRSDEAMASTVYAPGNRDTASLTLLDWHETLGPTHPASIMFLEQRGLIKIEG